MFFTSLTPELLILIEEKKADIIALTEIKAKNQKEIVLQEYSIPGFDLFLNGDPKLGVALYIREDMLNLVWN